MGGAHNEERTSKSASVKIVNMGFSDGDLDAARVERLREIQRECLKAIPERTVFLAEIAAIVGLSEANKLRRWGDKAGVKYYYKVNQTTNHKKALCVSEEDAEKIIRLYHAHKNK